MMSLRALSALAVLLATLCCTGVSTQKSSDLVRSSFDGDESTTASAAALSSSLSSASASTSQSSSASASSLSSSLTLLSLFRGATRRDDVLHVPTSSLAPPVCNGVAVPPLADGVARDLTRFTAGTPVPLDTRAQFGWNITINLCYPVVVASASACTSAASAAACQQWSGGSASLGNTAATLIAAHAQTYVVNITGGTNDRKMGIELACGTIENAVEYIDELASEKLYMFRWTDPLMCAASPTLEPTPEPPTPGTPSPEPTPLPVDVPTPPTPSPPTPHNHHPPTPSSSSSHLSGGSIFLIIVVVAALVYCLAGAAYQRVRYDADGAALIPNRELWAALPSLVRDGGVFAWRRLTCARGGVGGGVGGGYDGSSATYDTV